MHPVLPYPSLQAILQKKKKKRKKYNGVAIQCTMLDYDSSRWLVSARSTSISIARRRACSAALELSLKTWSICSKLRPFVSGTKKNVQISANRQNTAKKV